MILTTQASIPDLTQVELDETLNTLPVGLADFAQRSWSHDAAFGVVSGTSFRPDDFLDTWVINKCARDQLIRNLIDVSCTTEETVGYNFSTRYHKETFKFNPDKPFQQIMTEWPGIESLNVTSSWTAPENNELTLDYRLIQDAPVTAISSNEAYITLDGNIVKNPKEVLIRDTNGNMFQLRKLVGDVTRVAGDFKVRINTTETPYSGETLDVYPRSLFYIDIPSSLVCSEGTTYLVYPGTEQIISEARPRETLDNGDLRIWVYVWVLANLPDFGYDIIDLRVDEYYKMLETVEVKCRIETTQLPVVYKIIDGTKTTVDSVTAVIKRSEFGLVELQVEEGSDLYKTCFGSSTTYDPNAVYYIELYYKTDPDYLPSVAQKHLASLSQAILQRVAAELPLESCGCPVKQGYIHEQQQPYTEIRENSFTGTMIYNRQYGSLHGQMVYSEIIGKAYIQRFGRI